MEPLILLGWLELVDSTCSVTMDYATLMPEVVFITVSLTCNIWYQNTICNILYQLQYKVLGVYACVLIVRFDIVSSAEILVSVLCKCM